MRPKRSTGEWCFQWFYSGASHDKNPRNGGRWKQQSMDLALANHRFVTLLPSGNAGYRTGAFDVVNCELNPSSGAKTYEGLTNEDKVHEDWSHDPNRWPIPLNCIGLSVHLEPPGVVVRHRPKSPLKGVSQTPITLDLPLGILEFTLEKTGNFGALWVKKQVVFGTLKKDEEL